jgi:hypothetical protein
MRSSMLLVLGAVLLAPAFVTAAWSAEADGADAVVEEPDAGWAETSEAAPQAAVESPDPEAPAVEAAEPAGESAEPGSEPESAPAEAAEGTDALAPAPEAETAAPEGDAADTGWAVESDATPLDAEAPVPSDASPEAPAPLGTLGYDAEGHPGRIHVVVPGDTLWDISDAYLGTPWVWPSIWQDNRDIENPHMIYPGDHIWITPSEMRRVSLEEAEALMARRPPAAPEETEPAPLVVEDAPAPPEPAAVPEQPITQLIGRREQVGFITAETLAASASIVDSLPPRVMLGQEDKVYIGLGWGDVEVGDQFTIFRENDRVVDPDTKRLLGYHVDILGWLEVIETHEETSVARIRESGEPIEKGDRLMVRERWPDEIVVQPPPEGVDGKLSYFARSRTVMAAIDFVYLNRGTLDGLEVGSPLEVYRTGYVGREEARHEKVKVPDRVVAELVVVKAEPETAVAFVTHSEMELELGDRFRGATR